MTCSECGSKLVFLEDNGGLICPRCGYEPGTDEAIKLLGKENNKDEDRSVL